MGLGARGQLYDHVNNPPLTNGFKRWTVGPSVSESSRLVSANGPDCRGFMEMSIMACLIYARNTNTKPLSSVPQTSPFEEKICLACSVPPFLASYGYISWQDLVSQHVDLAMEHIIYKNCEWEDRLVIDLGVWLINGTDCSEEGGSIKDRWSALQDTLQSAKVGPVSDSPYLEHTTSPITGNQGAKKSKGHQVGTGWWVGVWPKNA